ncbi:MAG: hypothetical protein ACRD5H_00790 [Nitrososphaerales archaeon]
MGKDNVLDISDEACISAIALEQVKRTAERKVAQIKQAKKTKKREKSIGVSIVKD